jgi:predicted O-methyltransferase YrrM
MTDDLWTAVDAYINDQLVGDDPTLDAALQAAADNGLPEISVTPAQGKFLYLLATMRGARRVLEIGTLAAYSTIWLARALPTGGSVTTLEADPRHGDVAHANIARAGLSDVVDVRVGPALDTLPRLADEGAEPFDLVFIDADKINNANYIEWALRLTRPGSVIVVDNVIREGTVLDGVSADPGVVGSRALFDLLNENPRVTATAIQTVGSKGYDGFVLAVVTSD